MSVHDHVVDVLRRVSRRLASRRPDRDRDERARELERTDETRELIGQAKGILMERHTLDDEAASRMLAASSQDAGATLVDTAQWMRGRARHRHAESVALPDRDPHETADERDQLDAERAAWGHGTDGA